MEVEQGGLRHAKELEGVGNLKVRVRRDKNELSKNRGKGNAEVRIELGP